MNIQGWEYDYVSLPYWENHAHFPDCKDYLFESECGDVACLIYSVTEVSMMSYRGFCAVLEHKEAPTLLLDIRVLNFLPYAQFSENGNLLFLKVSYRHGQRLLILNLSKKTYAIAPYNPPNLSYTLREISEKEFEITYDDVQKQQDKRITKFDRAKIDMDTLKWQSWKGLARDGELNIQKGSCWNIFQNQNKLWQKSLEQYENGELSAQEFVDVTRHKVLYYSTPFGTEKNGKMRAYSMRNDQIEGEFFPAFSTMQACMEHFQALGREEVVIFKGTIQSLQKALDGHFMTRQWGIVIDPHSNFIAIPPGLRVTPKSLKY